MKGPLLPVALLYVAGILLGDLVSPRPFLLLAGALGVTLLTLVWNRARPLCLCLLILLIGWTNFVLRTAILSPNDLRAILGNDPQIVTIRGVLRETPSVRVYEQDEKQRWRTTAQIEVTALQLHRKEWKQAAGLLAVSTPGVLTNFFARQTVEVTGVAHLPRLAAAEGTFDYRAYLKHLGIYYQLSAGSAGDWKVLSPNGSPPLADRFRIWARKALALGLPCEDESLRLEWALTLGWKTVLTEEVSEPFIRAATYHIFAVDGLRMAIIFGIFFGLFRALGLPRAVCGPILIPLIWFYTALTGWPASAIRATVMLTIVIIGWTLRRPGDLLNSLFAAALVILIWEPQQLFQAGFQLSFFVVLCMILMLPVLKEGLQRLLAPDPLLPEALRPRWRQKLRTPGHYFGDLLLTSFAAWIGSLPLVAYYFNIVTPVSTPANVLAVPLCGLVLISNLSSLLLAGWFPAAAELFNHAGWACMEWIRLGSQWFAEWPRAYFYVAAPTFFTSALYYSVLLAAVTGWLFRAEYRRCKIALLSLLAVVWGFLFWSQNATSRLTVLPLDGGSAIYFEPPRRKGDLLIDCGTANAVESVTKPFLRAHGVNRLQTMLLTHGDVKQIGGAQVIADLFSVQSVCASPVRFRSPAYREALESFRHRSGFLRTISRNEHIGPWTVLHPDPNDHFPQADDNAVVLRVALGGARVLLLSDLGRLGQNVLLERTADLRADVVVAGLPVQTEALSDALIEAIQPKVIIVADSEFPAGERASPKLCERLDHKGVPVLYTRSAGAVTIEFRGDRWELRTISGIRIRGSGVAPSTESNRKK